jgi:MFS family permease
VLQRIGVRATLMRIMVLWGLCCTLLAFMTTPVHFYVLRFLLGAAEAGFFPGVIYYLTRWAPPARRARLIALFMASIALSGILGGPISASIMHGMAGVSGLAGWQWVFILEGLPSCVVGVVAFFYLSESPADARWLEAREKAALLIELDQGGQKPKHGSLRDALAVVRTRQFAALAIAAFALLTGTGGIFLWLPSILRNAGVVDVWCIGLYSSVPFTIGAIAQFLVARNSDRTGERRLHACLSFVVAAIGWCAAAVWHDQPVAALAAMSVAVAGTLAAMGPFWTLPPRYFAGPNAAVGIAIVTTIGGVGNFVSPPLVGFISASTGSLVAAQLCFATLMLISAIALFFALGSEREAPASTPNNATI